MTGKEETSPPGRGGNGDQAHLAERLQEIGSIWKKRYERKAKKWIGEIPSRRQSEEEKQPKVEKEPA